MEKYDVQKVVGQGSYGKAILCKRKADNKLCIIKQISLSKLSAKEAKLTEQEATLLAKLRHPNIVSFWESFLARSQLHIVMEYADGGDLDNFIKTFSKANRGKCIPEKQVLNLFVQISLAIKHIHDRKILHRDLKSQNVFLTSTGLCKLGDFGVSKVLRNTVELACTQIGTPYYMSPEIMDNQRYNSKTDIWSLGCILYELMCQRLPFDGASMKQLCNNIARATPAPPSSSYSQEMRDLVRDLLIKNPKMRPGVNSILSRPVVRARIASFLGETKLETEFSHTVLHGVDVLRSVPAPPQNAQAAPPNTKAPPLSAPAVNPLGNPAPVVNRPAPPSPYQAMQAKPSVGGEVKLLVQQQQQQLLAVAQANERMEELRKQQAAVKAREEQARRASDLLLAQEKERMRLLAVERLKVAAAAVADSERRAKEKEAEVLRRIREREIEIAKIRAQQHQLAKEQMQAARKKEEEAARIAKQRRDKLAEQKKAAVLAPYAQQAPVSRPKVNNAAEKTPSKPYVFQPRMQDGKAVAKQQQQQPVVMSVKGSAVLKQPTPVQQPQQVALKQPGHPAVPKQPSVPVLKQPSAKIPTGKIMMAPCAPIPPFRKQEPSSESSVSSVPRPVLQPQPSPSRENRAQAAGVAVDMAQEVLRVVQQEKVRIGMLGKPQRQDFDDQSSGSSGSSNNTPVKKGSVASQGSWFSQLEAQMGQLKGQVQQLKDVKSPSPVPLPPRSQQSPAQVEKGSSKGESVHGKMGKAAIKQPLSNASGGRSERLSYPVAHSGAKQQLPPQGRESLGGTKDKKSVGNNTSNSASSSASRKSVGGGAKMDADSAPSSSVAALESREVLEQRKAERVNHRVGFKEFLKGKRDGAEPQGANEIETEVFAKPAPILAAAGPKREQAAVARGVDADVSSFHSQAVSASSSSGQRRDSLDSDTAAVTSQEASSIDKARLKHEKDRAELRRLIQAQKRRLQTDRENAVGVADEEDGVSVFASADRGNVRRDDHFVSDLLIPPQPAASHSQKHSASPASESEEVGFSFDATVVETDMFQESPLLGMTFLVQRNESAPFNAETANDIVIDETAALEYSMMLNQMQSILQLPSVRGRTVRSGGLACIEEGGECGSQEDDDEFEEDSVPQSSDDEERNSRDDLLLTEDFSDDEADDEADLQGDGLLSTINSGDKRRGVSSFSDDGHSCSGAQDPFNTTTTPVIMDAIHRETDFELSDCDVAGDVHLTDSALMDEEYLSRITHLRHYLQNQLGVEQFNSGMSFLGTIHLQGDVEEDEELLNELEARVGVEGLHFLDDMFQLIALEARFKA